MLYGGSQLAAFFSSETLSRLYGDFINANDDVEFVKDIVDQSQAIKFDCHHISYLAICFLKQRVHYNLVWVHGLYRCAYEGEFIRHSWIGCSVDDRPAIILELDPCQLNRNGWYENDEMPKSRIVMIADPARVELPDTLHCAVSTAEVFARYQQDCDYSPVVDYAQLDKLVNQVKRRKPEMIVDPG
jgi:hypothetical protein